MRPVTALPENAKAITDAVLTRGGRVRQGWAVDIPGAGFEYYETFHYPGALNYQSIFKHSQTPDWA